MGNLESAYRSLDNAKREERELISKKERFEEIYDILKPFCESYKKYLNISETIEDIQKSRKGEIINILIALAVYIVVFSIPNLAAVFWFHTGIISSTIGAAIGSFGVCTYRFFRAIFKDNKKLKSLQEVEEALCGQPKYEYKSLQDVLELVAEDRDKLRYECYVMSSSIKEYESVLDEANKELAEEILSSSGIDASVTLSSSMKVLAKRYEPDKK